MSISTKIAGLIAAIGALAAMNVAVAQGVPPDARITNPPIAAGQQTSMHTPMGETGVYSRGPDMRIATIVREEEVAAVYVAPAPVALAEPVVVETTTMGAAPAPEPIAKPKLARRADRN